MSTQSSEDKEEFGLDLELIAIMNQTSSVGGESKTPSAGLPGTPSQGLADQLSGMQLRTPPERKRAKRKLETLNSAENPNCNIRVDAAGRRRHSFKNITGKKKENTPTHRFGPTQNMVAVYI